MLENGENTEVYEIYFLDQRISVGNRVADNVSFHILDDFAMQPFWVSWTGWKKGVDSTQLNLRPDPIGGLRDNSFINSPKAFKMGFLGGETKTTDAITGMTTAVDTYMRNNFV